MTWEAICGRQSGSLSTFPSHSCSHQTSTRSNSYATAVRDNFFLAVKWGFSQLAFSSVDAEVPIEGDLMVHFPDLSYLTSLDLLFDLVLGERLDKS